jgi:hypothetical protein
LGGLQTEVVPGKKLTDPTSTNKSDMVVHISNPSCGGGIDRRIALLPEQKALKNNVKKGGMGLDSVVELLPSKHKALSSNPSTEKKICKKFFKKW